LKRDKTVDYQIKAAWLGISKMYNAQAAKFDMTMAIGFVLLNIDLEKGTPATKIAPLLGMEPRSLTRMLKSLEEKGWISRIGGIDDKRLVNVCLTEAGKKKREIARKTVIEFNQLVSESISQEKLSVFFEVIQEINRIVETKAQEEKLNAKENNITSTDLHIINE
jgi:MarR family transcriptional regulator, organic hydroperoxide resistance regulator